MISNALDSCMKLNRAHAAMVRRFDNLLGSWHGLGFNDFIILHHLGQAQNGRLRRVDLAERLGLTVSGVTRSLIPLEKIGMVSRISDPRDARVAYAVLTETGRQVLTDTTASAEQISQDIMPTSTENALAPIDEMLRRIR